MSRLTPRFRPTLEILDERRTPAVTIKTGLDFGTGVANGISIFGDNASDTVTIIDNGTGFVNIKVNNGAFQKFTYPGTELLIRAGLGGGNDKLFYISETGLDGQRRGLSVNMGAGNDVFAARFDAAISNESSISFSVLGGSGNDDVRFTFAGIGKSLVAIAAELGSGSDKGAIILSNGDTSINNSIVAADIDLGTGNNKYDVTVRNVGNTGPSQVQITITGGDNSNEIDTVQAFFEGVIGDTTTNERSFVGISATLQAGNDVFRTRFSEGFQIETNSLVSIAARGNTGRDTLTVRQSADFIIRDGAVLDIFLDGGAGNDTLEVRLRDAVVVGLEGRLRTRMFGGSGADTISFLAKNSVSSTGIYDLVVMGGSGDDIMAFDIDLNSASVTFNPSQALVDGGGGNNTLSLGTGIKANVSRRFFTKVTFT